MNRDYPIPSTLKSMRHFSIFTALLLWFSITALTLFPAPVFREISFIILRTIKQHTGEWVISWWTW